MNAADRCTRRAVHSMAASRGCGRECRECGGRRAGQAAESGRGSVLRRATRSLAAPDHPCTVRPHHAEHVHAMAWPTTRHAAMVHGVNDWSGKTMLCLKVRYHSSYKLITMCERIGNASAHGHAITVQHPLEVRTNRDVRIRNGGCGLLQLLGILG